MPVPEQLSITFDTPTCVTSTGQQDPLEPIRTYYGPKIKRVMRRLTQAERHEPNLHFQADYRQSWICLSLMNRGIANPFVISSYLMYGVHPSRVWELIVDDRKKRLGAEYSKWYGTDDMPLPDVPKIPPAGEVIHHPIPVKAGS